MQKMKMKVPWCLRLQKRMAETLPAVNQRGRNVSVDMLGASPKARTSGLRSSCGSRPGRNNGAIHGGRQAGLRKFF